MSATKIHPACTITKMECDYLNGLKIAHIRKNLTQDGEPQRYSWERRRRRKRIGWAASAGMHFASYQFRDRPTTLKITGDS